MLRKRSRPFQKEHGRSQLMADLAPDSSFSFSPDRIVSKARGFFTVSSLFVGFTAKSSSEQESAKSPTSPLDFGVFVRSPRSPAPAAEGQPKSWDCPRVGLGLVDSLSDDAKPPGRVLGSQLKIHLTTPPKLHLDDSDSRKNEDDDDDDRKFENEAARLISRSSSENAQLGCSSSSSPLSAQLSLPILIGSGNGFMGSLTATGIELSEDYTCIISHGPNPKTTHIFGGCVLDSDTIRSLDCRNNAGVVAIDDARLASNDFLSSCFSCEKKLEGEDIYMYRGERAFCSRDCRDKEIKEEMEKAAADESVDESVDDFSSLFQEEAALAL